MNNDLISRSELKEAINTWDKFACLPNGELEPFRNLEHPEMFEPYVHLRDILNAIDNAPTVDTDLSKYSDNLWKKAYERGKKDKEGKTMTNENPSFNEIHSVIKDLLYKPVNEKLFKYTSLEIITLILMALDVIMERVGEENV